MEGSGCGGDRSQQGKPQGTQEGRAGTPNFPPNFLPMTAAIQQMAVTGHLCGDMAKDPGLAPFGAGWAGWDKEASEVGLPEPGLQAVVLEKVTSQAGVVKGQEPILSWTWSFCPQPSLPRGGGHAHPRLFS